MLSCDFVTTVESSPEVGEQWELDGAREAIELAALSRLLVGSDYFIDVGANKGLYMVHAARALRGAKLLAIEANPRLRDPLTSLAAQLKGERPENEFSVEMLAISETRGRLDFYADAESTVSSIFSAPGREKVSVPTVPLDDFFLDGRAAFIKIDVEGAEYRVLRSAERFLAKPNTRLFLELHAWGDRSIGKYPTDVLWLLCCRGFACERIGTHYHARRAGAVSCIASFLRQAPPLYAKSFVHRVVPRAVPRLRELRSKWRRLLGRN